MFFNKKSSKKATMLTKFTAVFMSAVIFSLLTGAVTDRQIKDVSLVMVDAFADSEKTTELTTRQTTVSEFLAENNVELGEFDRLSMLMEDELYDEARLVIRKGRNFTLNIDGNIEIITTTKKTIREAFEEAGVSVSSADRVEPGLDSNVEEDMNVSVFRVSNEIITVDTEIPFKSREVSDSSLAKGKTAVKVRGVNGLKRTTYSITTENGVETKREVISETTLREPTTRVIAVGTKAVAKSSGGTKTVTTNAGQTLSYSKKLTVSATAYTAASGKKTASGRVAQYGVIAVDPKVIPLGTKLYVESTDDGKSWQYGYCVAGDTGGAIKGNKIDLFFNSRSECLQFGRRSAIVYVLN
ncbi:MAG: G5 domain-containing protein [Clostridia bacterium]|nr:G5 domain-containing protein [Clostridia bacterium]